MPEDNLKLPGPDRRIVGMKQTVIAVEGGLVERVVLAKDADDSFKRRMAALCRRYGVPVESLSTRAALGDACGIEVGAAVVGIKK